MRHLNRRVWPYIIECQTNEYENIIEWCRNFIGSGWFSFIERNHNRCSFAFKSEESLLMLKLVWNIKEIHV